MTQTRTPRVVVGVDGSAESNRAVDWAAEYTRMSGGVLELVGVSAPLATYGLPPMTVSYDFTEATRELVAKTAAPLALPPEQVRTTVLNGSPALLLVAESAEADLLVVGSRGLGGFSGLLLGSVSAHAVHHAKCPVVVIH